MPKLSLSQSRETARLWERLAGCDYARGLKQLETPAGQTYGHVIEPVEALDHPCSGPIGAYHVNGYGRFILCQGHVTSLGRD